MRIVFLNFKITHMKISINKLLNLLSCTKEHYLKAVKTFVIGVLIMLCACITFNTSAQTKEDTTDGCFHDDLLNHLVGTWKVTAIANDNTFTATIKAEWVMNHQYLHIYEKANENISWLHAPLEVEFFIGYNHISKHYVVHEMTVFGSDGSYEGFCYAYRDNNEIKLIKKCESDSNTITVQHFIWEPTTTSWHSEMRQMINGKEGEVLVDQKLVASK